MITLKLTEGEYKSLQNVKIPKFAKLLIERGETVSSLSNATGISRPALYRYYYGEKAKGIQFDTLDALCKHFGMSAQDVIEAIRSTQQQ